MGRLLNDALAHRTRLAHTVLAVALAVSLLTGTIALGDTIDAAFHRAASASPGGAVVLVRSAAAFSSQGNSSSERQPVPDRLLAAVEAVPGVKSAWGTVVGYAQLVDSHGDSVTSNGLPTLGSSWAPGDALVAGKPPANDDQVVIDQSTAQAHGLHVGDTVKVLFENTVRQFVIAGLQKVSNLVGSSLASFDLSTTQEVMGRTGTFDAIAVAATPGVSPDALRARIAGALPDTYEAVTNEQAAQEAEKSWTQALGFLTTGLLVFAMVALLVCAFIIFNTFAILVAQRARELSLLRAIGASRRQVTASVLGEAIVVGAAGSAVGVVGGFGAAHGLLSLLKATGFDVPATSVSFGANAVLAGLGAGLVVTLVAAVLPARRATRVAPVDGLAAAQAEGPGSTRSRLLGGAALAAVGLFELATGLYGNARRPLLAIGIGGAALLVGIVALGPVVARPFARLAGRPLGRVLGEPGVLARDNAIRNPRRTAATAASLMVGIGLIGVVSILASSMQASAAKTVEQTLNADFVVTPKGTASASNGVPPLVADRLRQTPGVQMVSEIRGGQFGLDGKTMTLLAVDPATVTAMHDMDPEAAAATRQLSDGGVLVRDTVARRHGWKVGSKVPMTFARTGTVKLVVEGTFSSTSVRTDYVISLGAYEANYTQQLDIQAEALLTPGTSAATGRARIEKALADLPNVVVMDRAQVLAAQEKQVRRFLVPISALLGLSVLIALLGIANTLALAVHERTRELGLLRALGMARSQLRSMVRAEAVIVAALGALMGAAVAVVFGWVLVHSMHGLGLTTLVLPYRALVGWIGAAIVAGIVAATLPARRAARLDVLDAVSTTAG